MRDNYPRVPRDRLSRTDGVEKAVIGFGCAAFLLHIAFWAVVFYIIIHFVLKYW